MAIQVVDSDTETLHKLGYAQELLRRMGGFSNFAVSFTIISILSGCLTAYGVAMFNGGPIDMNIGWPLVGVMVIIVGLAMAEVCSSYPTAGGLYYWSAKLGGKNGPAWSWFTGWFNLVGQVAVTAGIDGGLGLFASAFLNNWFGYPLDPPHILLVFAIALIIHGLLNTFGIRLVALLNDISVWWHLVGVVVIVAFLLIAPKHHQSAGFIFFHFNNGTGASFPGNVIYVFLIGLLLAQYTFTGYDASAHMTEETKNAATAGPRGIVLSIVVSLIAGWILLIGLTSAIQNYGAESTAVVPAAQIFIDAAGRWPRSVPAAHRHRRAVLLWHVVGHGELANDPRLLARRRGGRPSALEQDQQRTRTPTNSIWLAVVGAFILFLPYLFNASHTPQSSPSRSSVSTSPTASQSSCDCARAPVPARPWSLGKWSRPIGIHRGRLDHPHQHPVHPSDGSP